MMKYISSNRVEDGGIHCPTCGSFNWKSLDAVEFRYTPPFGEESVLEIPALHCQHCSQLVELHGDVDEFVRSCDQSSVRGMIQKLLDGGHTRASLERDYTLPFGSLRRFETDCPPEALALLRCMCFLKGLNPNICGTCTFTGI